MSIETLRAEGAAIMKAEGIAFLFDAVESRPGDLAEGEYRPSTRTIVVDKELEGYPDEPFTIVHEIGHHFDFQKDSNLSVPVDERERRAGEYMVRLADSHGVGQRARRIANRHRPGSYPATDSGANRAYPRY